jgi:hypothetical protein
VPPPSANRSVPRAQSRLADLPLVERLDAWRGALEPVLVPVEFLMNHRSIE